MEKGGRAVAVGGMWAWKWAEAWALKQQKRPELKVERQDTKPGYKRVTASVHIS